MLNHIPYFSDILIAYVFMSHLKVAIIRIQIAERNFKFILDFFYLSFHLLQN